MKAIITTKYGLPDVLQLRDMEKPTQKDNEVLIKVHAASITRADTIKRKCRPIHGRLFLGLTKPKHLILGKSSFAKCKKALKPSRRYLSPVLSLALLYQMLSPSLFGSKKAKFSTTGLKSVPELKLLLNGLKKLLELGHLKLVIDRCYSLEEVAVAHPYMDTGRKKGNVIVIT